jgi:hypothetical protein
MLVSYNDDSGTHSSAKVVLLCGFLASADDWIRIDQPWQAVIHKPEWPCIIKAFHAADCVSGDGEFRGWSFAQRLAIFGDLINVILALPIKALGAAVVVDAFNALSVEERELFRKDKKATSLEFVFHLQMQQIIHKGAKLSPYEEIGVVFESSDSATDNKFRDMYIDYRDGFYLGERLLSQPLFLDKKQPPLQAADLLAYCTYQLAMENYFPRNTTAPLDVMPLLMRMLEGIEHEGGIYDAKALQSLLGRIRADDKSLIGNKRKRRKGEEKLGIL